MSETHDDGKIREMAYRLWQEAGSPEGREDEFWQRAKQRLANAAAQDIDEAGEQSFPASDAVNHM